MSKHRKSILGIGIYAFIFLTCAQHEQKSEHSSSDQDQKEILLIGTFHYHNPGADVVKTKSFDILSSSAQKDLDYMTSKIQAFNPTQVFVEWEHDEQSKLDSIYGLYREGTYFNNPALSNFYRKNEIFQLAFRAANSLALDRVVGIDYTGTDFPFDSLMTVVARSKQLKLQEEIQEMIQKFTKGFDDQIESGATLIELTKYLNTDESWREVNHFHCEIPLLAGPADNFVGPYLTSEWYRRNLYMWSLIQKEMLDQDQRIMVLVGASHAAMINEFIRQDPDWKKVGFGDIMRDE